MEQTTVLEYPILQMLEPRKKVGLIVVLTGEGKGKTTSALGMTLRSVGHGMKVCIIEFMKGDMYAGELDGLKMLGSKVEVHLMGKGFCGIQGNPYPYKEHRANAQDAVRLAREKISSGAFDMVILDEVNNAVRLRLVDLPQVMDLVELKPPLVHLILTGRDAHPDIIERADTVSEVREIKHAFRKDIEPQKGIDF
ncbi:MAG TPA: cob(I)yrinic acid a,c-diamide adenosyltransferase [Nitrospirota bacterium]|nr:cob(I)yrinic acid a,c-diamide adenosyltransferase [Nitrospirota bacterium]